MAHIDNNPHGGTDNDQDGKITTEDFGAAIFDDDEDQGDEGEDQNDELDADNPDNLEPDDDDEDLGDDEDPELDESGNALKADKVDGEDEQGELDNFDDIDVDYRFKLPDGRETTIQELSEGGLRQDDYTRKQQQNAVDRQTIETDRQAMQQVVNNERQQLVEVMTALLPPAPDPELINSDLQEYQYQMATRQQAQEQLGQLLDQAGQAKAAEQKDVSTQINEQVEAMNSALMASHPELKTPENLRKFQQDTIAAMAHYGFNPNEFGGVRDARIVEVMNDAAKWQALQAKKPGVKKTLRKKPRVLRDRARPSPKAQKRRDNSAKIKKATKTGNTRGIEGIIGQFMSDL